jgi:signal transduction histidine kinase
LIVQAFKSKDPSSESGGHTIVLFVPTDPDDRSMTSSKPSSDVSITKEEFDLQPLINSVLNNILDLAEAKNIQVSATINSDLDQAFADREKLEFIIMNLFSKAVNFAHQGKVALIVSERESGNALQFTFMNPEEKIPEEEHRKWVKTFEKGADKAKLLVEAHGGRLWLETEAGYSINFTLPKKM